MGNVIGACCMATEGASVKVIYWEGNVKTLTGKGRLAGEIMFEFPESMVCDADRFFVGHAIPALSIDEQLRPGKTYLVLPLDIFSSEIFSSSSISAFAAYTPRQTPADLKEVPLEYIKGSNGRLLIKVKPEFMARHLMSRGGHDDDQENGGTAISNNPTNSSLCSTPELRKEYEQLVRSRVQIWSPNLDTISEAKKIRYSPYRVFGLEREEKEDDGLV
ncbi:uncharacterized protein LOC112505548 [Cynara cardunculus var. scolymus]|uniref:DUF4228 domain-containing protein n=1 Tax=Cynara cardunculus var. scolymus TaxID=59895 RepID=A0A118K4U7_CYNCS|nr:uncharacterized protein LOC112505548 [Cynara cardunculus var. scolymus]KVI08070.1 Protein of unknown function DUF4228 [Cynara cardunculus var. scolymus]